MEFISNLMKRPLSLVLTEPTNVEEEKLQIATSSSLPNSVAEINNQNLIELNTTLRNIGAGDAADNAKVVTEKLHSENIVSLNSATNDNTISDFIGVPDHILTEFEDIFPAFTTKRHSQQHPLQLSASSSAAFPLVQNMDRQNTLQRSSSTSKASQTIEQLLLEINDNLNQAGLNDEVFAIASPVREVIFFENL